MPAKPPPTESSNEGTEDSDRLTGSANTSEPSRRAFIPQVVEVVDEEPAGEPASAEKRSESYIPETPVSSQNAAPDFSMKLPLDARALEDSTDEELHAHEETKHTASVSEIPLRDQQGVQKQDQVQAPPQVQTPEEEKIPVSEFYQQETSVGYPEISEHKRNPVKGLIVWAILVIAIAMAIGALIVFFSQGSVSVSTISITPVTPTPISEIPEVVPSGVAGSPTPEASSAALVKSDLSIQVWNGGGTKGAAGKIKSVLEEKGWTVDDVGNAPDYTYSSTEIYVKPDKSGYLELLKKDLKGEYTIGKAEATLEDNVDYDARIIVGKE